MAKTRDEKEVPPTKGSSRKIPNAKKTPKQTHTAQGVAKPTQSKDRFTLLKAAKKVADKPKPVRGRPRKVRIGEELEALTTEAYASRIQGQEDQQETGRESHGVERYERDEQSHRERA